LAARGRQQRLREERRQSLCKRTARVHLALAVDQRGERSGGEIETRRRLCGRCSS
jgi:hypothetical protein